MNAEEILRTVASLNTRTSQTERMVWEYKQELSRTRNALERTKKDLEETVRVAELLYEVNQKLGTVTDYLLKQQGRLDDKDCNSFEAMFNILLKQAESHEDGPAKPCAGAEQAPSREAVRSVRPYWGYEHCLIAIMLGRLEMDVDECIDAYSDLAAAVFGEKLSSIPINVKGDIKPRFDSAKLESAIQKVIEDSGASKQDLFNDGTERGCRVFVCTASRHTKDIVRLRSYSLPHEPNIRATISQAALATSAATTFFEPVSIGHRSFADGGLGANNPVDEVEGEASNIWCLETGDLKPLVKCFISIGTGNPGKKPFEDSMPKFLGRTVVQIATETENTERRFIARWARHFDEKRYFRFNVEQGLQEVGLEEYKKRGVMEAATEGYLTHMAQKFRVRDCIQNMRLKQSVYLEDFA